MKNIFSTTYVICPVGTTIELYTEVHPKIGQEFNIHHVDTGKVVQRAKVIDFSDANWNTQEKHYHVLATIIQTYK